MATFPGPAKSVFYPFSKIASGLCLFVSLLGIVSSVAAYNVCIPDDGYACTHEIMVTEARDLYLEYVEYTGSVTKVDLSTYWAHFEAGVADPDRKDPIYGNAGFYDSLTTITHFWSPDYSLGAPMEFNEVGSDDYPNAFQAATAVWSRALGEYSAGNKGAAYRYLGMVAHFLGDQTIPTHANMDTHGPDWLDYDAYEEWLSEGEKYSGTCEGLSPANCALAEYDSSKAYLRLPEQNILIGKGALEIPIMETHDRLLWLFLNTNQVADYFASDGPRSDAPPLAEVLAELNGAYLGDANHPDDPYVAGWAQGSLDQVAAACAADPSLPELGCPLTTSQLENNHGSAVDRINDADGDLSRIRQYSYLPGVRKMAALFSMWEDAITAPLLKVSIHKIEEIGFTDAVVCGGATLGMDDCGKPDYYVGMVIGNNARSCAGELCPHPAAAFLEDRYGFQRTINGGLFSGNTTRVDAVSGNNEDKTLVYPDYHFGQSYAYATNTGGFSSPQEKSQVLLYVWENDASGQINNDPYDSDDPANLSIFARGGTPLNIVVDLEACLAGDPQSFTVVATGNYQCNTQVTMAGGTGDDSDDVRVVFSVELDHSTRVIKEDLVLNSHETIESGDVWILYPDVELIIKPGVDLKVETGGQFINFGTIINEGELLNYGGNINNQSGGIISSIILGSITNTGLIENNSIIYNCYRPLNGTAPTISPAQRGCVLRPGYLGEKVCNTILKGTWSDPNCKIGNHQIDSDVILAMYGTKLVVEGTLTNEGTIDNRFGTIDNSLGIVNNCGVYLGNNPIPNPYLDCVLSTDASFCRDILGGLWHQINMTCTISDYTVLVDNSLSLSSEFTLIVTGTLSNFGIISNHGSIYDQHNITNNEGAYINNYGSIITDLTFDSAVIFNRGFIDNYGLIDIDPNGAVFDNDSFGYLTNRCGAQYTGALPINSAEENVTNEICETIFMHGFED